MPFLFGYTRPDRFKYSKVSQDLFHVVEKGDIITFSGVNFISSGIQDASKSMWNHSSVYTGHSKHVEAVASGVKEHALANYFDGKTIILVRRIRNITVDQVQKMMQKIFTGPDKELNKSYDYLQVAGALLHILTLGWVAKNQFDSPDLDICSEVVANVAGFAGIDIAPQLQGVRDPYPKDLAQTKVCDTVLYLNPNTGAYITNRERLLEFDKIAYTHDGQWDE